MCSKLPKMCSNMPLYNSIMCSKLQAVKQTINGKVV